MKRTKRTSSISQHKAHKTTVRISVGSESSKVLWIFDKIDRDGLFAFNINRSDFDHKGFLDKLISYSPMTWAEVRRQTMMQENLNTIFSLMLTDFQMKLLKG